MQRTRLLTIVLLAGLVAASPSMAQDTTTQSFDLQPGWNAIYLEVQPDPGDTDSVFGGLPISSAWTWNPSFSTVEFIQDPAEGLIEQPGWLGFFPSLLPEAFLTNLFSVQVNRAYLLKVEGDAPVSWTVTGRPSLKRQRWVPDSFNLVGFSVDPAALPTFGSYLASEPAHAGQPVYRLDGAGVWQEVTSPFTTQIVSGEAYWVFSEGASDFQGPISIRSSFSNGIDFGGSLPSTTLRLHNVAESPTGLTLRLMSSANPVELSVFNLDEDTGETSWPPFPSQYSFGLDSGEEILVDLAVRRQDFSVDYVASILEIRDGAGFRRLVPVTANTELAPATSSSFAGFTKTTDTKEGLWVGFAQVRGVSESQTGSAVPVDVGNEFNIRLIVHNGSTGSARLLKEVIIMWQDGTMIPAENDPTAMTPDQPGHYVLLTDDSLVPNFEPATLRDGQPVGLRISTAAYDFEPDDLAMTGSFGGTLAVSLTLEPDFPTHPFRHQFHPDHNNLDELYVNFVEEAYTITRDLTLTFSATHPFGLDTPSFGGSTVGGTFKETISGLHKNDITVEGPFLLERVSMREVLNQ